MIKKKEKMIMHFFILFLRGEDQFAAIHQHFHSSDLSTQSMLLTSYMKFGNYYDNLISEVTKVKKEK